MHKPPVWMDRGNPIGCGVLDLPEDTEFEKKHNYTTKPDCLQFWYSDGVKIPGEATIPDYMSQPETTCIRQGGANDPDREFPWWAPGTAPVFGPCGTLGGSPHGCKGNNPGEQFGDCCRGNCDGFALGKNAEEYSWPGSFPVTEWNSGSTQEVVWNVQANHAGGYSYRLCKMPEGGITELTEECFQELPLNLVGDTQWIVYTHQPPHPRIEIKAKRTTEGTFPPGSQWTTNPFLPYNEEGGSKETGYGHVIDLVEVSPELEPGNYVLSFRWDCKCSSQVWNVCSNIVIK